MIEEFGGENNGEKNKKTKRIWGIRCMAVSASDEIKATK